jgi:prenyltransferase beta subunit
MLQVARLAPRLLSDASGLVISFLDSQRHPSGGFANRAGEPDLYYTVFGLEGLAALQAIRPTAPTLSYLRTFGGGEGLDLVHLACLARCWANMPPSSLDGDCREAMLGRLAAQTIPAGSSRSAYDWFLTVGAYNDLGFEVPHAAEIVPALQRLQASDGAFSNQPGTASGSTPATAAAVTLTRYLGFTPAPSVARWLLSRCSPEGGFRASPTTPLPDLLSTATALHALVGMHESIDEIKERCLDFIDTLWTNRGGFYGHWADDVLDCEYTYYGLLALGHLSL